MGDPANAPDRRRFLGGASTWFMTGGLAASYGACGAMGARYLFPAAPRELRWLFAARVDEIEEGSSLSYRSPTGERIAIARRGATGTPEDFIALSSTCPHLGCQVHWQPHENRFFCPCHNGVFTPAGEAVEGPPAEAGQSLSRYPLRIEDGLLLIQVPVEGLGSPDGDRGDRLARADQDDPPGPGHDPCLFEPPGGPT